LMNLWIFTVMDQTYLLTKTKISPFPSVLYCTSTDGIFFTVSLLWVVLQTSEYSHLTNFGDGFVCTADRANETMSIIMHLFHVMAMA